MSKTMRRSPIHSLIAAQGPNWGNLDGAAIALDYGDLDSERAALTTLGLADLSALPKLGLKGPNAASRLQSHQVNVPPETYGRADLPDHGHCVRLGQNEFLLESGPLAQEIPRLSKSLGPRPDGVARIDREDATFALTGSRAPAVLAQICAYDFGTAASGKVILSRLATVSGIILPQSKDLYRIWVDPSFAVYLWQVLFRIVAENGGQIIGARCFYTQL